MSNFCVICLNNDIFVKNISETCAGEVKIIEKLKVCIPEVKWEIDSEICLQCLEQLENFYIFRNMCVKSYLSRQAKEWDLEVVEDTVEEIFLCNYCSESFDMKESLERHIINEHTTLEKEEVVIEDNVCEEEDVIVIEDGGDLENRTVNDTGGGSNLLRQLLLTPGNIKQKPEKNPRRPVQTHYCHLCGNSFYSSYYLKRHKQNVHRDCENGVPKKKVHYGT